MPPTVATLAFSPIARDARVLRQVAYLSRRYDTHVVGYGAYQPLPGVPARMWPVPEPTRAGRRARTVWLALGRVAPGWAYPAWYWRHPDHRAACEALRQIRADIIHANDVLAAPAAFRIAAEQGARVVLDLHEYAPLEFEGHWSWDWLYGPMTIFFLRRYAAQAAATVTVNATIAGRYRAEWGFDPAVVMNTPDLEPGIEFRPTDPARITLVHHGSASRRRRMDLMLHAVARADVRFHLHLMLVGDAAYIGELRALAERLAPERIHFHAPVRPHEVARFIAQFDLGFYLLPPVGYNEAAASPNKFFDFVNAGLGVVIGPSPEMTRLSAEHRFGLTAPSFEPAAVAQMLDQLRPAAIDQLKRHALTARLALNAEAEMGKLLALYQRLLTE